MKLEGGADYAPLIAKLVHAGIPVMAHIGLLPQKVKTSGGYVVSRPGVQADMNGNFISLHGIVSGRYTIDLPMKSTVRNLKTNRVMVRDAKSFTLDVTAGSTYWFSLE